MSQTEHKSLVVILLGPPGSGKGTHAIPLSKELAIPHISTGDLFREHIRSQTPLGIQAKGYIDLGHLVPDELVLQMVFERVSKQDCAQGYILDGFPRTLFQAKELDKKLSQTRLMVLNFQISDEKIVERVGGRIGCKGCGRPYHKKFAPPEKEMVCDTCKAPLMQREDDQEEIIRKRLQVYRVQTEPLAQYYAKKRDSFKDIDSEKGKEEVFQAVLEALSLSHA
jgi:adenylate kinase